MAVSCFMGPAAWHIGSPDGRPLVAGRLCGAPVRGVLTQQPILAIGCRTGLRVQRVEGELQAQGSARELVRLGCTRGSDDTNKGKIKNKKLRKYIKNI